MAGEASRAEAVRDAVRRAELALGAAGVSAPRADAEVLAAHVLGLPRGRLVLAADMDAAQAQRFGALVEARVRRTPLQHLLGRAAFRRLDLAVGAGVFVPRPETELLAGWGIAAAAAAAVPAADAAAAVPAAAAAVPAAADAAGAGGTGGAAAAAGAVGREPVVVDLCAGSGAIALAVAHEAPNTRVYAVERDPDALRWLRRNVEERMAAGDRPVEVVEADVTDPDALPGLAGRVDVVLCNPPYVPDGTAVPPEVADHDPAPAVFGGPDGLAVIRPVVALAAALLRPGGAAGIEHDDTHGAAVPALLTAIGHFTDVTDHADLAGRPRFTTARRA